MKLCKDCKFAEINGDSAICAHPSSAYTVSDPVFGKTETRRWSCESARTFVVNICGKEAIYFEPKS